MILNTKIYDDFLVIDINIINKDTIDFIVNTILDGIETRLNKNTLIIPNNNNLYTVLMLLNDHYSLVII